MALKPNTIKALFGKLAPLADDAAGAVAKYGDDVLDDFTRLTSYVNKANATFPDVPMPVKTALQAGKLNDWGVSNTPPQGVLADLYSALDNVPTDPQTQNATYRLFDKAVGNAGWRGNTVAEVPNTDWLGRGRMVEYDNWHGPNMYVLPEDNVSVRVPELPLDTLVRSGSVRRPHRNTALGRWFESIKNDPTRLYHDDVQDVVSTPPMSDEELAEFIKNLSF